MSQIINSEAKPIDFSILIGLVSTEDSDRIFEMLNALRAQTVKHSYEVIIADRRNNSISNKIKEKYPEVSLIGAPSSTSLPELRTLALEEAVGTYYIVTEDHTVASLDWLASIWNVFETAGEGTVAVGGCVENGVYESPFDWATFLCEYSYFLESVDEGNTNVLPGMNVAYHHSIFDNIERSLLTEGFWETTIHPSLLKNGFKFYSSNQIKLYHCKKFSFSLFAKQRFIYSRYYAALRFKPNQPIKKLIACLSTPVLPLLLLFRSIKQITAKKRLKAEFKSAIPFLLVFYIIWSLGEMTGYLLGKGDSLSRIE